MFRRRDLPVPLAPRHRRDWSRWGRYCVCGLRWDCPDRHDAPPPAALAYPTNRSAVWYRH